MSPQKPIEHEAVSKPCDLSQLEELVDSGEFERGVEQMLATRQTPSRRTGVLGSVWVPIQIMLVTGAVVGALLSTMAWRSESDRNRAIAAEKTTLEAELRGVLESFVGATEAHIANGDFTEAAHLIEGLDQMMTPEAGLDEQVYQRFGRTRTDLAEILLNKLGYEGDDVRLVLTQIEGGS